MQDENLKLEDLLTKMEKMPGAEHIPCVAIIGAGVMGQGIAQTIASAGIDVILIEKNKEKGQKRAVKLWSAQTINNLQLMDKTTRPHRNCETLKLRTVTESGDIQTTAVTPIVDSTIFKMVISVHS